MASWKGRLTHFPPCSLVAINRNIHATFLEIFFLSCSPTGKAGYEQGGHTRFSFLCFREWNGIFLDIFVASVYSSFYEKKIEQTLLQAVPWNCCRRGSLGRACVCDRAAAQEPHLLSKSEHQQGQHRMKAEHKGTGKEADSKYSLQNGKTKRQVIHWAWLGLDSTEFSSGILLPYCPLFTVWEMKMQRAQDVTPVRVCIVVQSGSKSGLVLDLTGL